jgi:hypothetical protein
MVRIGAAALVLATALAAGCGGSGDDGDAVGTDDGVVDRSRPVPAEVTEFVDAIVDPVTVPGFVADYRVLNKNGGGEHTVHVTVEGGALVLSVDGEPVDANDDAALSAYGIFSGFLHANPVAAIRAAAARADAGDAVFSERGALECIAVPVQEVTASSWCVDATGVIGFVETPSVRYERTG